MESLETGFTHSAAALVELRAKLDRDLEEYEAHVAAGGEPIGEWEDGYRLWEQDQLLEIEMETAEASLLDLRKAYVLAAYHHWERAARTWTAAGQHAKHATLVERTQQLGHPIHGRLTGVHRLANTLKHNNGDWAAKLFESWPEVMAVDPALRPDRDWYGAIHLTDQHMGEVWEAIRSSGPEAFPARWTPPWERSVGEVSP